MRAPEFEASLTEAKLYPELWRLLLGMLLVLFMWISATILVLAVAAGAIALGYAAQGQEPMLVMGWFMALQTAPEPSHVLALLATFTGCFVGALVAPAALHFRGPDSLFGPWQNWWHGFRASLLVVVPILGGLTAFQILFGDVRPNLEPTRWLMLILPALILILVQTGAEEMLFRGYLQQQLAARFRARWIWMGLPAVIFTLLHWNPQAGANLPIILAAILVFALIAADLTERTGSLGAAMGLHFGNNVMALTLLGPPDMLTGLSLYTSPAPLAETGAQSLWMAASIPVTLLIWWIITRVLDR